jgi:hypothetical protein
MRLRDTHFDYDNEYEYEYEYDAYEYVGNWGRFVDMLTGA